MADPRLTPARGDIAAKFLEGKVEAISFVEGETFVVIDAIAPIREQPFAGAGLMTQALRGERITIYDRNGEGWAWGQLAADNCVGWLPSAAVVKWARRCAVVSGSSAAAQYLSVMPSQPPVDWKFCGGSFLSKSVYFASFSEPSATPTKPSCSTA